MPPRLPYFIIESGCPGYEVVDQNLDPAFAELKKKEESGSLPPTASNAVSRNRAEIHAKRDMLLEDVAVLKGGKAIPKIKDSVVVARADERGRIFIDKDKPEVARSVLRSVRVLHRGAYLDTAGYLLEEEGGDPPKPLNKGGRPTNESRRQG